MLLPDFVESSPYRLRLCDMDIKILSMQSPPIQWSQNLHTNPACTGIRFFHANLNCLFKRKSVNVFLRLGASASHGYSGPRIINTNGNHLLIKMVFNRITFGACSKTLKTPRFLRNASWENSFRHDSRK